jgi:hypothetical protein
MRPNSRLTGARAGSVPLANGTISNDTTFPSPLPWFMICRNWNEMYLYTVYRQTTYPLHVCVYITPNLGAQLLYRALEPRRCRNCESSQPPDKIPQEVMWYLGGLLLLLLARQRHARTGPRCNNHGVCSGYWGADWLGVHFEN